MCAFPLLSVAIEGVVASSALNASLVGKWFAFWSVGVRLISAGSRQVLQPEYTAKVILGLESGESLLLVRELGRQPHRNKLENVAMVSDLGVALVLLVVCVIAAIHA